MKTLLTSMTFALVLMAGSMFDCSTASAAVVVRGARVTVATPIGPVTRTVRRAYVTPAPAPLPVARPAVRAAVRIGRHAAWDAILNAQP